MGQAAEAVKYIQGCHWRRGYDLDNFTSSEGWDLTTKRLHVLAKYASLQIAHKEVLV